jgi:NAD(P)-dependent dehydrogenase (short-subunit alcohol dehydrogenase family)
VRRSRTRGGKLARYYVLFSPSGDVRLAVSPELALAALWLCSPAASWVTVNMVEVDGGTESTNWPFD